ncbi:glycoside hydrolase family 3 protein [Diplodia corticola]|uniref:beta-glucosidase n=1 Tax=Diplodia corticola TaxID=236234 RepID=A0A1J9S197_9PEZI|nr:glycoside hydrolase family 3 protein [Diplodia corticola]OJD34359.1 glycoside hydrolase family 3 protein [Diplodia corticola]
MSVSLLIGAASAQPLVLASVLSLPFFSRTAAAQSLPSDSRYDYILSVFDSANQNVSINANVPDAYVAAPWYPAPYGGWTEDWSASYAKAAELVSNMTLAEKTNITVGTGYFMGRCVGNTGSAPRLGFPQLCLQDSALGVKGTENNTAFTPGITVGATWNKDLMYARGEAIGEEFRGKGVNIHLGPTVGPLGRKPRGGRNWEGFGSDPVLQAVGGALTIKGVQAQGVMATIKHFIGNEQESYRMYNPFQAGISANIDDRTMHEIYLWPFAEGVRAGVVSVMGAYNAVNGSASTQNSYLINNLLKDELGFQGFIMSDWFAQISGAGAALAGLDMSMPGDPTIPLFGNSWWAFHLTEAVLNGSVPVDRLNDMATRVVAAWYQVGQDQDYPDINFSTWTSDAEGLLYPGALISPSGVVNEFVDVQGDHAAIVRNISTEAVTLLKNDNGTLPLKESTPLKIFGTAAEKNPDGINSCSDKSCNKGTLGMGWGSGTADFPYLDSPMDALNARADNLTFYNTDSFPSNAVANEGDVALVFITADSGENYLSVEGNPGDRTSAGLNAWHNGDELVQKAAEKYDTVIVIVQTVGPILVEEWIDLPSVKAVLFQHLPGQEAGESLTTVLYGDQSPSGHLPYSIVKKEDDLPDSVGIVGFQLGQPQDTFSEGLYIDYRYLNKQKIAPRYPFGHGLSYTSFNYSATIAAGVELTSTPPTRPAKGSTPSYSTEIPQPSEAVAPEGFDKVWRYLYSWLSESEANSAYEKRNSSDYPYPEGYSTEQKAGVPAGGAQGGNPALWDAAFNVSVTVSNTGAVAGKAVAQLYVQYPEGTSYDTPVIQLRDFGKTATLQPGESETLALTLTRKDVSVWDVASQNWIVPAVEGEYKFWVGESSGALGVACSSTALTCEGGQESPVA